MTRLVLITDNDSIVSFDLKAGDNTIGRSRHNDIVLPSIFVSRRHAVVTVGDAFVTISDADSQNGSFVNGEQVVSQVLVGGDIVTLGGCELQFFQNNQEFREVEARGLSSVPNWVGHAGGKDDDSEDAPTAREGPRST